MSIDIAIKEVVREEIALHLASMPEPKWITIEAAAKICDCGRSVIDSLVKEAPENNFPAARLGTQTVRIDKHALLLWLRRGGLVENGEHIEGQ